VSSDNEGDLYAPNTSALPLTAYDERWATVLHDPQYYTFEYKKGSHVTKKRKARKHATPKKVAGLKARHPAKNRRKAPGILPKAPSPKDSKHDTAAPQPEDAAPDASAACTRPTLCRLS